MQSLIGLVVFTNLYMRSCVFKQLPEGSGQMLMLIKVPQPLPFPQDPQRLFRQRTAILRRNPLQNEPQFIPQLGLLHTILVQGCHREDPGSEQHFGVHQPLKQRLHGFAFDFRGDAGQGEELREAALKVVDQNLLASCEKIGDHRPQPLWIALDNAAKHPTEPRRDLFLGMDQRDQVRKREIILHNMGSPLPQIGIGCILQQSGMELTDEGRHLVVGIFCIGGLNIIILKLLPCQDRNILVFRDAHVKENCPLRRKVLLPRDNFGDDRVGFVVHLDLQPPYFSGLGIIHPETNVRFDGEYRKSQVNALCVAKIEIDRGPHASLFDKGQCGHLNPTLGFQQFWIGWMRHCDVFFDLGKDRGVKESF